MNRTPDDIQKAIQATRTKIADFQQQYPDAAPEVTLLAVSKTKPVELIRAAMQAGQQDFGENYLDEALLKIETIGRDACTWHFIGQIQSNKTAAIAAGFDWVHGIDRQKIAKRLAAQRPDSLPPLNCCIQLNIDSEDTKAGVQPGELPDLCAQIAELPQLKLRGLMCIPAPRTELNEQRALFHQVTTALNDLQTRYPQLDTLSMGMSGDLEAAIAEGSTLVRIGTALFGARPPKPA